MRIFNKTYDFSEPAIPSLDELTSMTSYEYGLVTDRYRESCANRSPVEQLVMDLARRWRYFTCVLRVPGLTLVGHLPPPMGHWFIQQISSGKWWLIGPEAWWTRSKRAIFKAFKEHKNL